MTDLATLYESIYLDPTRSEYGRGLSRSAPFLPRIRAAGLQSVVAFGCGHGDELVAISGSVPVCLGIDFALPSLVWYDTGERTLARLQADLCELPTDLARFDAVVSFDVLEHLREDQLDQVLRSASATAPRACLVVANMPDPHRLADGRLVDLHLLQHGPTWWAERIQRITGWRVQHQALAYVERFGFWCGDWP